MHTHAYTFRHMRTHADTCIRTPSRSGFLFQLVSGFGLPFPLNIIFLPLTLIEWFLRIQITMTAEVAH